MKILVCLITTPNLKSARALAKVLVRGHYAACVNIIDKVSSYFYWKGKVEKASECLLIAKTTRRRFKDLKKKVQSMHPYSVPEIIALPVMDGNKEYLSWVRGVVKEKNA